MPNYFGKCSCKNVHLTITLPEKLAAYQPRKCDCDFCLANNLSYLSHPSGKLSIKTSTPLKVLKQGSNQASFLACSQCNTIVATTIELNGEVLGA